MAKVTLNLKTVEAAAISAFRDSVFLYSRKITEVISTPGAFPSTAEDLVDTGAFRSSQRVSKISDTEYQIRWSVDYAIYLYYGWTTRSGTRVEGRRWDEKARETFDLQQTLSILIKVKLA